MELGVESWMGSRIRALVSSIYSLSIILFPPESQADMGFGVLTRVSCSKPLPFFG